MNWSVVRGGCVNILSHSCTGLWVKSLTRQYSLHNILCTWPNLLITLQSYNLLWLVVVGSNHFSVLLTLFIVSDWNSTAYVWHVYDWWLKIVLKDCIRLLIIILNATTSQIFLTNIHIILSPINVLLAPVCKLTAAVPPHRHMDERLSTIDSRFAVELSKQPPNMEDIE